MSQIISKVSALKVGKVVSKKLQNQKRSELISAINKSPIASSYLSKTGFKDDEVADHKHHGGENKALFFMSNLTYKKISEQMDVSFCDKMNLGENILVENLCEDDVCVGDVWQIGEALVQISQPREPCWKLSANSDKKQMTAFIFKSGLTGWYAKVLKEGKIKKGDDIIFISRQNADFTIAKLNALMCDPLKDVAMTKSALEFSPLGEAFRLSLEKRYRAKDRSEHKDYHE